MSARSRRKKLLSLVLGILLGVLASAYIKHQGVVCNAGNALPSAHQPSSGSSSSSSSSQLIFIGVMTTQAYVNTRALAVWETWGAHIPGRLQFFSSEGSTSTSATLPLVALIGVDDSYPPQKKSFAMLKHMHDHHLEEYEWFMRADDDVYVRTERLERLLRGVDARRPWFIGQAGRGLPEEEGMLSLEADENYCMGGPGIIFSRETLRRLGPHIADCLANLYSAHEDVEIGRCVRKSAGIACTWSYEMQAILYHNHSGSAAFSGDLRQKEVHRAITLHPVKRPATMYRLHKYITGLKIRGDKQERIHLHRDIAGAFAAMGEHLHVLDGGDFQYDLAIHADDRYFGEGNILGKPNSLVRFKPRTLDDLIDWEFIGKALFSAKDFNPRRSYGSMVKEGLNDVIREIMEQINRYSQQRGRVIDFKQIQYGYFRLDPIHGVDLLLDMKLLYRKHRGRKMTVTVRRHAYIQKTFTGFEVREVTDGTMNNSIAHAPHIQLIKQVLSKFSQFTAPAIGGSTTALTDSALIHFILPLSGRHATFVRFMQNYEQYCLRTQENSKLLIVLYNTTDANASLATIAIYRQRYGNDAITTITLPAGEVFARGRAFQHAMDFLPTDALMFFIDVDMLFNARVLMRVRRNAVRGRRAYFPIVFSMYKMAANNGSVPDEELGEWRQFGFGLTALYKSDYLALGGYNTSIAGWGAEDVNLYDKAVNSSTLRVVRAVDADLVHVWHPVVCDPALVAAQLRMCKGTQASMLGSLRTMQEYYRRHLAVGSADDRAR